MQFAVCYNLLPRNTFPTSRSAAVAAVRRGSSQQIEVCGNSLIAARFVRITYDTYAISGAGDHQQGTCTYVHTLGRRRRTNATVGMPKNYRGLSKFRCWNFIVWVIYLIPSVQWMAVPDLILIQVGHERNVSRFLQSNFPCFLMLLNRFLHYILHHQTSYSIIIFFLFNTKKGKNQNTKYVLFLSYGHAMPSFCSANAITMTLVWLKAFYQEITYNQDKISQYNRVRSSLLFGQLLKKMAPKEASSKQTISQFLAWRSEPFEKNTSLKVSFSLTSKNASQAA